MFILVPTRALGPERGVVASGHAVGQRPGQQGPGGHGDPPGTSGAALACLWAPGPPEPPVWVSVALPSTERQGRAQVAPGETRKQVGCYRADPANEVGGSDHSLRAQTGVLVGGQLAFAWLTPHQARPGPKSRQRGSAGAPPAQNPGGRRKCVLPGGPWWPRSPLVGSRRPQSAAEELGLSCPWRRLGLHPTRQPIGAHSEPLPTSP